MNIFKLNHREKSYNQREEIQSLPEERRQFLQNPATKKSSKWTLGIVTTLVSIGQINSR